MAVQLEHAHARYTGLSTDEKPGRSAAEIGGEFQPVVVGSVFVETDTGRRFVWQGSWPWVRQEQTIESLLERLIDVNTQILDVLAATQRGHEEYLWEDKAPSL
jgi:hypothetical protein